MGSRRRYQKRKAARASASGSSEAGDGNSVPALKRNKKQPCAASASEPAVSDEAKIQTKLEAAGESEEEAGKILKLKKEFVAANDASSMTSRIPFFFASLTTPEQEKPAAALLQLRLPDDGGRRKKTKKVLVKRVVPTRVMEHFKERLFTIIPDECVLTDGELAAHSREFQETYAENLDLMNKMRAWQKALLEQYDRFGYAVDESEAEVTDDDDDDDDGGEITS